MDIPIGTLGRAERIVTAQNTALAMGSGTLPVFATPGMAAMMEEAAARALEPYLEGGQGSVGTHLDISHDSATPVGMKVWAEATVTQVDGRTVSFTVAAFDEAGPIGKGTHRRFLIQNEKFLAKTQQKRGQ